MSFWAAAAFGLQAVGVMGGAMAKRKEAKVAERAARLNRIASAISTATKVQDLKDAGERLRSTQLARAAATGVDATTGSLAEVITQSAAEVEKEIHRVRYTGALREQGAMATEDAYRKSASNYLVAGTLGMGADLLRGISALEKTKVAGG